MPGWEKMVPQIVADMIKKGRLYGYQPTHGGDGEARTMQKDRSVLCL